MTFRFRSTFFATFCVAFAALFDSAFAQTLSSDAPCFEPVKSKLCRVGTPAQKLTIELRGSRDIYLYATFGGDSYDCDQAIWASPTLIDKSGNRVDLTTVAPVSAQTGWGSLILNKNHRGEGLKIGKDAFATGFWAHAPSLLHFRLDKPFEKFEVSVGLDPNATRGSVEFQILSYPIEIPKPQVYEFVNASGAAPPIPPVAESATEFNPEGAQKLLDAGIEELVFLRHYTYNANHVYTDHVNCDWLPGAGFCILNLKTGEARDLFSELKTGMIHRFDISFDAQKIVFDFKKSPLEGYRIYEANLDGTGLRQLTFPQDDEAELVAKYRRGSYARGTDDMQPCYLPDGGIAFVSTRPQFSVLCDSSDNFTVSNLYRIDANGENLRPLTFSALNEQSPAILPDGRILYHRWEYVDKAAGNAKALWAINPDGTGAAEVYGDNISYPESMIYARPIPDSDGKIVFLGASHCCPNNALGTVITIDQKGDVRDPATMRYVTDDVRTYHHNGFHFRDENGEYKHDLTGVPGRLFKDPFPISETLFVVSRKPAGFVWSDKTAYDLVLLDENGNETPLFNDENVSCWLPYPLLERDVPPVRSTVLDEKLAAENRALCAITDVYAGMPEVERGSVKYVRVLEQAPRPWAARKTWDGEGAGTTHAHSALGSGHLSLKIQLGVVPVEEDGSAQFYVPADRAIYFQALDEKFRAIQTERTYVNYRPGETRSCVGCHETQRDAPSTTTFAVPIALTKPPVELGPQPGQESAELVFDYDRQIQPIWDARCVSCHNGAEKTADNAEKTAAPDLRGTARETYSVSYWNLVALASTPKQLLGERAERNEDAAFNEIVFIPPYRLGTLSSPLGAWLCGERTLKSAPAEAQAELDYLFDVHRDANVELTDAELLVVANWLDVNVPYHRSYWGRINAKYEGLPDYRPEISPADARSRTVPEMIRRLQEAAATR